MDIGLRLEQDLELAVARAAGNDCPPLLADALRYAVFPGGARIRPRLTVAVAHACGNQNPTAAIASASAIELLHCASLVHDDLPCFDDSPLRRGQPSVHAAYGAPIAVLAGDALIVLAFDVIAAAATTADDARLAVRLTRSVAAAVGAPRGIASGQAWECEGDIDLASYHRAKTAALFCGAAAAGAATAGADDASWYLFGEKLGLAFQVADDVCDALGATCDLGKPVARDAVLGRPNAVRNLGAAEAIARVGVLVADALDAVPPCPGREAFRDLVMREASHLLPPSLARVAA